MDQDGDAVPSGSQTDIMSIIEETLSTWERDSPYYDDNVMPVQFTDEELYGILAGNILDELDLEPITADDLIQNEENNEDLNHGVNLDTIPASLGAHNDDWQMGNPQNEETLFFSGNTGLKQQLPATPIAYFEAICDNDFLSSVMDCSNKYGDKEKLQSRNQSRKCSWKPLSLMELKVFLALLLHMGLIRLPNLSDYWKKDIFFHQTIFVKYMSRNRFLLILRMLNVQINEVVTVSYEKVKYLFDFFNTKMSDLYYPTEMLTIDESIMLWRGRLKFRQYLKGKRHKYGVKFYMLADDLGVVVRLHLYGGASDNIVGGSNHVKKVVHHLLQNYKNVGHSLFTDNFYTSVTLVRKN